jgi:hypothetical protein
MRSERSRQLQESLRVELEATTIREHLDSLGRRRWLVDQLDNYLDRWLGFAALGTISMKSLRRDDLFIMLLIGTEVYTDELNRVANAIAEKGAWKEFRSLLLAVQRSRDISSLGSLRTVLTSVRNVLYAKAGNQCDEIRPINLARG